MADIVLALKPKWLELILSSQKTAEFRRVMPKYIAPGDKIYLYNKRALHGYATVASIQRGFGRPASLPSSIIPFYENERLWLAETFEDESCLTVPEAFEYLSLSLRPGVIFLRDAKRLASPIPWNGSVVQNFVYFKAE